MYLSDNLKYKYIYDKIIHNKYNYLNILNIENKYKNEYENENENENENETKFENEKNNKILKDLYNINSNSINKKLNKIYWNLKVKSIDLNIDNNIFKKIISKSYKKLVIVEPRCHPLLSGVLKNFITNIDNYWSMTILHGMNNYNYIKNIIGENTNIKLINLDIDNLTVHEYNKLLLSINFWNLFDSNKILIFQTDCLIRNKNINNFIMYDYIGAPWKKKIKTEIYIELGNGGLSIRDRNKILYILNKYRNYIKKYEYAEDLFFSTFFKKENFNIPDYNTSLLFSSEQLFSNSCGLHKSYEYMNFNQMKILLDF